MQKRINFDALQGKFIEHNTDRLRLIIQIIIILRQIVKYCTTAYVHLLFWPRLVLMV